MTTTKETKNQHEEEEILVEFWPLRSLHSPHSINTLIMSTHYLPCIPEHKNANPRSHSLCLIRDMCLSS